jgi:hypothetical protein
MWDYLITKHVNKNVQNTRLRVYGSFYCDVLLDSFVTLISDVLDISSALKMEVVFYFETSVNFYWTVWWHTPCTCRIQYV